MTGFGEDIQSQFAAADASFDDARKAGSKNIRNISAEIRALREEGLPLAVRIASIVSGREPSVFRCSAGFRASATALPGSGGVHFELERGRLRFRRPVFQRWRRLSGVPEQAPPPAAPRPAGISGRAPLRRRVCAVPAAAARGRAGSARAGGCWRRGWRGRWPARTGPGRAAAPGRGRGAPGR